MSFELRVDVSGLCLFMIHPNEQEVAVVMPDARKGRLDPRHVDYDAEHPQAGAFHVGYMRLDLACLTTGIPIGGRRNGPRYEVVHRFDRETLEFVGVEKAPLDRPTMQIANFSEFAPKLRPIPRLFDPVPPEELLMRTVLRGGTVEAITQGEIWNIDGGALRTGVPLQNVALANFTTWKRQIDADYITLRITQFGGASTDIQLRPVDAGGGPPVVRIELANLCSDNPLEWTEFDTRMIRVADDVDFKWLYRLLEPPAGQTWTTFLNGGKLPYPVSSPDIDPQGGLQECNPGEIFVNFP